MGLETGNYIGDLIATNPAPGDPKAQGDDHIRLLKAVLRECFGGFAGAILLGGNDTGSGDAYALAPATPLLAYGANMMVLFRPTAANTTAAPTLNISGLGPVPIKAVDGGALVAGDIPAGRLVSVIYDGTAFQLMGVTKRYIDQLAFASALPNQTLGLLLSDGTTAFFGKTTTGFALNAVKGADIASAATINLTAATGEFVHVTGTAAITAITIPVGAMRTVVFDGALTLTHGAALLLPGAANIATAAGDRMDVRGDASGAVVTSYTRANGRPVIGGLSTLAVLTTTQTWVSPKSGTAKITAQDGGRGGSYNTGGSASEDCPGGSGGNAGVSFVELVAGASYTATVGAGSPAAVSPANGGASSFVGQGITVSSANAQLKVPGGSNTAPFGGGSLLSPAGASSAAGFGVGGQGGTSASASGSSAGGNGAVIIEI